MRIKTLLSIVTLSGSLAAQAALYQYEMHFSDVGEANPSPAGTGYGTADYDSTAHTLALSVSFSGLIGTTTAAHIHGPTTVPFTGNASVMTTTPSFVGFPLGVSNGVFNSTLNLTLPGSWNPSFVTANGGTTAGAEAAFFNAINNGRAYFNIHSTYTTSGEIRGWLQVIPEPSSLALVGLGGLALALRSRRQKGH